MAARRQVEEKYRQLAEAPKFRGEALGMDRYYRRYWVVGGDLSRLWVESRGAQGGPVQWGLYATVAQLEGLRGALDVRGVRENQLREGLELLWGDMTAAMRSRAEDAGGDPARRGGGEAGGRGGLKDYREDLVTEISTLAEAVLEQVRLGRARLRIRAHAPACAAWCRPRRIAPHSAPCALQTYR